MGIDYILKYIRTETLFWIIIVFHNIFVFTVFLLYKCIFTV